MNSSFRTNVDATAKWIATDRGRQKEAAMLRKISRCAEKARLKISDKSIREKPLAVYKGKAFPVAGRELGLSRNLPRWKDLSPWFRVQLGVMAMDGTGVRASGKILPFHLHLGPSFVAASAGIGQTVRDKLLRQLKLHHDRAPPYFFVIEEYKNGGKEYVRAHVHGAILIESADVPHFKNGKLRQPYRDIVATEGWCAARMMAGRDELKDCLRCATGNASRRRGRLRAVRKTRPNNTKFSSSFGRLEHFVSYAFKNVEMSGVELDDQRIFSNMLFKQRGRELWRLISGR